MVVDYNADVDDGDDKDDGDGVSMLGGKGGDVRTSG